MKNIQLAYEFYYWLPWWEEYRPADIYTYIMKYGVESLDELIEEYKKGVTK